MITVDTIRGEDFLHLAAEVLRKGKTIPFVASGPSMSPLIADGDTVILWQIARIRVGDVVLLRSPSGLPMLHRVVRKMKDSVVTRGDACLEDDEPVPFASVVGRAIRVSGRGYNFHLTFPFSYLIGLGILRPSRFRRYPVLRSVLKRLARLLG